MNTLAQGIGASMIESMAETIPQKEMRTLFCSDYMQFVSVTTMIQHSKKVAHWVTAEVISANGTKVSHKHFKNSFLLDMFGFFPFHLIKPYNHILHLIP